MANPWGKKVGAWAEDVERADEEAKLQREAAENNAPDESFPSLEQAAAAPKPKKKSKGQKLSLSELQSGQHIGRGAGASSKGFSDNKGLTVDEMLSLPKGPREKTADDLQDNNRWGSSRSRGGPPPPFNESRRGGGGGFGFGYNEDERRSSFNQGRSAAADRDLMPSRADEVDNWAARKSSMPPPALATAGPRRFEGDRFDASSSRADDVDNWASAKKFTPAAADRRPMGFGSSYRDPKSDSYRRDDFVPPAPAAAAAGERRRLVLNPRTVPLDAATPAPAPAAASSGNRPNPFGDARPREQVLAEKAKLENGDESKHGSRPTSADSSRADSVSSHGEFAPQPHKPPKINPFGGAIPRENILTKRGVDYMKTDLDVFKAVDRDETEEEINMKKEISDLRERLAKFSLNASSENGKVIAEDDEENEDALKEKLATTEAELEARVKELNEKARQEKRTSDRQGSSGGRSYENFDRPGSQSGRMESSKSFESLERPRSRGSENRGVFDGRVRPIEDRRQGRPGFTGRQRSDTGGRW